MKRNRSERGYSLVTIAVMLVVLIGMLGITVDLGRMYIVKNELQAFADSAALASAFELDGTSQGITRAGNIAASGPSGPNGPNRWNFSTQAVTGAQILFSQTAESGYVASPGSAAGYRFVRVTASVSVPLYFMAVIQGIPPSVSMGATASAGQSLVTSAGEGLDPFSPDAINAADPDFGFEKGGAMLYTLKWAPPGKRQQPGGMCNGDAGSPQENGASDRGYLDVGQGEGNDGLVATIVNNDFFLPQPLTIGGLIDMVEGNKHVGPAMESRFCQDLDVISTTYAQYRAQPHNGRRLVTVPVNLNGTVVGFAAFFLPPAMSCWNSPIAPCCAEYVGPAVLNSRHGGGGTGGGAFVVRLFQ